MSTFIGYVVFDEDFPFLTFQSVFRKAGGRSENTLMWWNLFAAPFKRFLEKLLTSVKLLKS